MTGKWDHQMGYLREVQANRAWHLQYFLNPSLSYNDITFVLKLLLVMIIARFVLCGALRSTKLKSKRHILPVLFRRCIKPKKELKFSENLWYFCWHSVAFCWGLKVLWLEGLTAENPGWPRLAIYERSTMWYWFPTPAESAFHNNPGWPLFPVMPYMRYYYLTQLAFWLSCFCYLWIETMRRDATVFFIHHIATCVLVSFSYVCSFWRAGLLILVIHDSADIFLYLAKTLHYLHVKDRIVDFVFLVFVAVFCLSRLMAYPVFCVWPCVSNTEVRARMTDPTSGMSSSWQIPGAISLPVFLIILQVLHIFWFGLIVKMIMRTIGKSSVNEGGDIRSDDEFDVDEVVNTDTQKRQKLGATRRAARAAAVPERQYKLRPRKSTAEQNRK